jgi:hypothetical protein
MTSPSRRATKLRRAKEERIVEAAIQWLTWKRGELEGFPAAGYGPDGAFGLADLEEATAALVGPPKPEPTP